jgi:hypothetical protein
LAPVLVADVAGYKLLCTRDRSLIAAGWLGSGKVE